MADYLSVTQLAVKFDVSVATVYNWVAKGCPYLVRRKGKREIKMFDPDTVAKWVDENIYTKYRVKAVSDENS